jgi:branched-chain amino acid transport system substrate-binding protein
MDSVFACGFSAAHHGVPWLATMRLTRDRGYLEMTTSDARRSWSFKRGKDESCPFKRREHRGEELAMCKLLQSLMCVLLMILPASGANDFVIGSLVDLTGETSDTGQDAARGASEAIRFLNDNGGINGKKIRYMVKDFGSRKDDALNGYLILKGYGKIGLLLQWGFIDTQHLREKVNEERIASVTDSLFPNLCDPKIYPYNFLWGADYSTDGKAALTAWYEEEWKKSEKWKTARASGQKPKLVCLYSLQWEPGQILASAIKDQAKLLGIEVGEDQNLDPTSPDAKPALLKAADSGANVIWHGNTSVATAAKDTYSPEPLGHHITVSVATAINDSHSLGIQIDHIVATHGFDRRLIILSGKGAEGVLGTAPCAFLGEAVPGMEVVVHYCKKVNPSIEMEKRDIHTVRAWAKVLLAAKALEIADQKGQVNGPGIKAALESLQNWSPFDKPGYLGLPPITITPEDHRPTSISRVYKIQNGKFELINEVDMKNKFPDQWPKWLGK